jgi:hypothetical protein
LVDRIWVFRLIGGVWDGVMGSAVEKPDSDKKIQIFCGIVVMFAGSLFLSAPLMEI